MRKSDFEAVGGFNAVKDVLAEDYQLGKLIHEKGKKVLLSKYMIKNVNEYWSFNRFLNRHTRWAKIRWKIAGWKYFTEPLNNPVFIASLMSLIDGFSNISLSLLLSVSTVKIAGDTLVSKMINTKPGVFHILIPFKDLIIGLLWFVPFITSKVTWRNNKYVIGEDTLLKPYEEGVLKKFFFVKLKAILNN